MVCGFRTEEGRLWWRREAQHRNEVVGVPRFLEPHAANTPHHHDDEEEEGEPDRSLPTFIAGMRRSRRLVALFQMAKMNRRRGLAGRRVPRWAAVTRR